jgi:hypothetical protein
MLNRVLEFASLGIKCVFSIKKRRVADPVIQIYVQEQ